MKSQQANAPVRTTGTHVELPINGIPDSTIDARKSSLIANAFFCL